MENFCKDNLFELKRFLRISSIRCTSNENFSLKFGYYSDTGYEIKCDKKFISFLVGLTEPRTKQQLQKYMNESGYPEITMEDVEGALGKMYESGMLQSVANDQQLNRYDRHLLYYSMFSNDPLTCQKKLKESTVVLIGVGGIGSWVSYNLAGAGVGTIIGVDHDVVELSNLTRQILYCEDDVGKIKVECAKKKISKFNSEIKFIPINQKILRKDDLRDIVRDANLVILSADSPVTIRSLVNTVCVEEKVAWTITGYTEMHGICGPLIVPGETACLQCVSSNAMHDGKVVGEEQEVVDIIGRRYQAPSYGPLNCFISGLQSMEAIKYLTGFTAPQSLGTRILVNSKDMKMDFQKIYRNPKCPLCGVIK